MKKNKSNAKKPRNISKSAVTVIILLVSVAAILFIKSSIKSANVGDTPLSRVKGSPRAKVHIVEYADFQCPACAVGDHVLRDYIKQYPSDIYLEAKYFPISSIHPHTLVAAAYAECAARQNRFWPFKDLLFDKQKQWAAQDNPQPMFQEMAGSINIDLNQLKACTENDDTTAYILEEKAKGKSRGVDSTPTYFVNGKMTVGPKPLEEELQSLLKGSPHE